MEDFRSMLYHQIDIVKTKDYGTLDMLIKIELQAKLLSLNVIAPESFLTVLKLPKRDLIELILSMNLYYEDNVSETHEENDMDEGMDNGQNDYQENNFYNYYGGTSNQQQYWQYNQHYHQDHDQDQWHQWQHWQQWNQWNGYQ